MPSSPVVAPPLDPALDLVSSVLIDAPPERVFQAYADAALLARWWGPAGFSSTFHEFEFRPGGRWRFELRGPDGAAWPNEAVFVEIARPERIVLDHLGEHRFRLFVTLAPRGGMTELVWRMRHESAAQCQAVRGAVLAGNEENFDRLGRLLFELER